MLAPIGHRQGIGAHAGRTLEAEGEQGFATGLIFAGDLMGNTLDPPEPRRPLTHQLQPPGAGQRPFALSTVLIVLSRINRSRPVFQCLR